MAKKIPMPALTEIEAGMMASHAKSQLLQARWPNHILLWKKLFDAAGGQAAIDRRLDHLERLEKEHHGEVGQKENPEEA